MTRGRIEKLFLQCVTSLAYTGGFMFCNLHFFLPLIPPVAWPIFYYVDEELFYVLIK